MWRRVNGVSCTFGGVTFAARERTLCGGVDGAILLFLGDGARRRIIVGLNGGVGARVVVAGKPITGAFDIELVRFAAGFVVGAHGAVFDVWCGGGRTGGVLVGRVAHGVVLFAWLRYVFAYSHCITRVGCAPVVLCARMGRLCVLLELLAGVRASFLV